MTLPLPTFEPDLAKASTLPAWMYTDPDILAQECERIFARTWQPVGGVASLSNPGDYLTADVAGEPLVLVRDKSGQVQAFFNVCQHRAGAVAEGQGNRKSLQCTYHGWTYGLDGRLMGCPEFDGVAAFDRSQVRLRPARCDTWGPLVFANLDDKAPSLDEVIGAIPAETAAFQPERYVFVERREYTLACNWKVYIDNFLEGYHVPVAHPGLFRELDYSNYRVETFRHHSKQHAPIRQATGNESERRFDTGPDSQALYYWVFPNWMLNLYPDHLQLNIIIPLSVDRTVTIFDWYVPENLAGDRNWLSKSIEFSEQVQREDIYLCEAVQRRLTSRAYDRGRFSVTRENGVHHFQGLLLEYLRDE